MTRRDTLHSMHEPFGDPFYFGPEFMSERFKDDAEHRNKSGYGGQTYKDVLDEFAKAEKEVRLVLPNACIASYLRLWSYSSSLSGEPGSD